MLQNMEISVIMEADIRNFFRGIILSGKQENRIERQLTIN